MNSTRHKKNIIKSGTMTMTTVGTDNEMSFQMAGFGSFTIDWDDGSPIETHTFEHPYGSNFYICCYYHKYSDTSSHSITITGKIAYLKCDYCSLISLDVSNNTSLDYLKCCHNQLTSLDISKNATLKYLYCAHNQLTNLDVSNNIKLVHFDCGFNQLPLDALFEMLRKDPEGKKYRWINIKDNPAVKDCNRSIAENKGWKIFEEDTDDWIYE